MAVTLKFLNFKHKSVESLNIKKLQWVKWEEVDLEHERLEEGGCPKLYWTEKHMRKRGVPPKKKLRPDTNPKARRKRCGEERRSHESKTRRNMQDGNRS